MGKITLASLINHSQASQSLPSFLLLTVCIIRHCVEVTVSAVLQGPGEGGSGQLLRPLGLAPTHSDACRRLEMSGLMLNPTAILSEMEIKNTGLEVWAWDSSYSGS